MSYSKTVLVGRLGDDPELKTLQNGQSVMSFRVATDETWKDQSGAKQKRTTWHRCSLWGKRAESLSRFMHKGDRVLVEGVIQHREYEKDGQKRTASEIKVTDVTLLGDGQRQGGGESSATPPSSGSDFGGGEDFGDDDLPF